MCLLLTCMKTLSTTTPMIMSLPKFISIGCRDACFIAALLCGLLFSASSPGESLDSEWMDIYAAGVLMPDQGTVEMTMKFSRPINQFGNSFDYALKVVPSQPITDGSTLLGLYVPTAASSPFGLSALARTATTTYRTVASSSFSPVVGQSVRVALSWGTGGIRLYINGQLSSSGSFSGQLANMPGLFRLARFDPFNVREIKVSDIQLAPEKLSALPATPILVADANTTFIATDKLTKKQYFQTARQRQMAFSILTPIWSVDQQVQVEGTAPTYSLVGFNATGATKTYTMMLKGTNHTGLIVLDRTINISIAGDGVQHVVPVVLSELVTRGHYKLNVSITDNATASKIDYSSAIAVTVPDDPASADGALDHYLGYHYALADHDPKVVSRLGYKTLRAFEDLSGFQWGSVEPERGVFKWKRTDLLVERAASKKIDLIGVLGGPPRWAAEDPGVEYQSVNSLYTKMPGRWKPHDLTEWGKYVYAVVSRYKNSVKHWEIMNEVDWHPPGRALTFSGSTQEYLSLLQVAYKEAKRADPTCNVLIAGFGLVNEGDPKMAFDLLELGAASSFDTFNAHAYAPGAKDAIDLLKTKLSTTEKPNAPFWITEQMWNGVSNESNRLFLTVEIYLSFLEKKFERFYQFGYEPFAFNRNTFSPTIDTYVSAVFQAHMRKGTRHISKYDFPRSAEFAIRDQILRTDGKTLSIIGQEQAENRIKINGSIESAVDIYGDPVAFTVAGNQTELDVKNVTYIVSATPLQISDAVFIRAAKLLLNEGFEDISGDIATGGLSVGRPLNWFLRDTTYDPAGKIIPTTDSLNGHYGMSITASGTGTSSDKNVYMFQDVKIIQAGAYRFSVYARRPNGAETVVPYLSVFDRDKNTFPSLEFTQVPAGGGFIKITMDVTFDAPRTLPVALIFGVLRGVGTLLVDDAEFVPVVGPAPTGLVATPGGARVDIKWNAVANASSYEVKSAPAARGPYAVIGQTVSTQFTHDGLSNGTPYYYVVSAVEPSGVTPNSTEAGATPVSASSISP